MQYVKLTAKTDTWFKEGTEAFHYDCDESNKFRISLEEFEEAWKPYGMILCRGWRISEGGGELNSVGEEYFDGESCLLEEFDIEITEEKF